MVSIWIGSTLYSYQSLSTLGTRKDRPQLLQWNCKGHCSCMVKSLCGNIGSCYSWCWRSSLFQLVLQLGHKKLMGRTNYIHLIEQLYRTNPNVEDETIILILRLIGNYEISQGTIQVWKTKMRKKRIAIPDRRKK